MFKQYKKRLKRIQAFRYSDKLPHSKLPSEILRQIDGLFVETAVGKLKLRDGDWIVKGLDGRLSVWDNTYFTNKYQKCKEQVVSVSVTPKLYAVIDTDNFGSDYPDEKFVGDTSSGVTRVEAYEIARVHNSKMNESSPRYYRVVTLPYKLQPGFQP